MGSFMTSEKITVKFSTASPYERVAAYMIDFIIKSFIIIAMLILMAISGLTWDLLKNIIPSETITYISTGYIILICVIFLFYNIFFEIVMKGQTPGKKFLNIRVIMDNGAFLTPYACIIRNIFRIVDFLPVSYIVGIIMLFVTKNTQRVGDLAAKTFVISEERIPIPFIENSKIFPALELIDHLDETIGENVMSAISKYIISHKSLTDEAKRNIQSKIVDAIANKTGLEKPEDKEKHDFIIAVFVASHKNISYELSAKN